MARPFCSAWTKAAMGPLPAPVTVTCSPSTMSWAVTVAPASLVVTSWPTRVIDGDSGRYHLGEPGPHLGRADLGAGVLGDRLDGAGELNLQPPGQVEAVLGLHDVSDAALARLAVDPDDGFVRTAHVLGVDGQVGHAPHLVVVAQ